MEIYFILAKKITALNLDLKNLNNNIILERVTGAVNAFISVQNQKYIIAIFPDILKASIFISDYRSLRGENATLLNELPITTQIDNLNPLLMERGETIKTFIKTGGVLATTPVGLISPCKLGSSELKIQLNDELPIEKLSTWLENSGYKYSDLVWSPGQYVRRGFIVDVFDPANAMPLRLEFFDDVIERIGAFKPSTQKSSPDLMHIDEIIIHGISQENNSQKFPLDLLPKNSLVIFFDYDKIHITADSFLWLWNEIFTENNNIYEIQSWQKVFHELESLMNFKVTSDPKNADFEFDVEALPAFKGNPEILTGICSDFSKRNYSISIYTQNPIFFNTPYELHKKTLSSGFIDNSSKKIVISDRELSGVIANEPITKWQTPLDWHKKLSVGQLVIHEDYGTGIFRGIENYKISGIPTDSLSIEFDDNQKLLIPVLQSYKLTPLNEHANENTKLDSLRGSRWKKSLTKIREHAHEEAKILLDIFAHRELERRAPFDEPEEMYEKFVKAFPFNETRDQLKAISEIMQDLSSNFPMDRLLVGDVGFGKTEVAMRAAFRVVASGFQVCVLVPTTVLAQQHYATFQSRLAGFPIKVGLLSRFVTKKQSLKILEEISENKIDILIGTHKLLQKGVNFKNLGLLIIDEEHRFGVMHKEGLKKIYGSVDVLSLSATPIPRTLAMSLRGLRSISVLSTPPENRLPVATFSGVWQSATARRAVAYELNRGGQVYFLSCRISQIESHKKILEAFFPQAKIGIAHGQLNEKELEQTMLKFYDGEIDILIATTIIESGLDVSRANTIIVDNSELLGLAQMYQLRGRVGRRSENAFAYFFYSENALLNQQAIDRFEAITTMTDLGSGYEIAKRDLDIRGAGEVGGTHQHGKMNSGNFILFYEMLDRELEKLSGSKKLEPTEVISDRGSGFIPDFYIPQEDVRVIMYRRLISVIGLEELNELLDEIQDRFGKIPEEIKFLSALIAVKNFGANFGIKKIEIKNGLVKISCPNEYGFSSEKNLSDRIKCHIANLGRKIIYM